LRGQVPTGDIYVIKFTAANSALTYTDLRRNPDGSSGPGALYPCWDPFSRDTTGYSGALAMVKAAAAAANLAGDTLRIDGVIYCCFIDDILNEHGWRSFGERLVEMVESLRLDLTGITHCVTGSIRSDGNLLPVTVVAPHAEWTGLTDRQAARALSLRMQTTLLEGELQRMRTCSTLALTCPLDGVMFDAPSLVQLSEDAASHLLPAVATTTTSFTDASVGILIGDSIYNGTGATPYPTHLVGPLDNGFIWNQHTGQFEEAIAGVNTGSPAFGIEMPLLDMLRAHFSEFWMMKGTAFGSYAAANRDLLPYPATVPPLHDLWRKDWSVGDRRSLVDLFVRTALKEAVRALHAQSRRPRVQFISIHLGSNDILLPTFELYPFEPGQVVASLRMLVDYLRREMSMLGMVGSDIPSVIIGMPSSTFASVSTQVAASVEAVRSDLMIWAMEDGSIKLHDVSSYETFDGAHLTTAGTMALAKGLFYTWQSTADATSQPLFHPSKPYLLKALKLSKVSSRNDTTSQIDEAISVSRQRLFSSLGSANVTTLLSYPYNTTPVTQEEYARATACSVEIKMVRLELLRVMPTLFMDGTSAVQQWQEDAAFRESSYLQIRDEIRRLENDIQQGLAFLVSGIQTIGDAEVISPAGTPISPGGTIFIDTV
jgi:hypothetical protein